MARERTEFDRQLEARDRVIEQVNQIFADAIRNQKTHGDILHDLERYAPVPKRLTIAQREYVRGYTTCRFDELWRNHIAWGFRPCGTFCATFEEVQRDFQNEIKANMCNGFHYWKSSNGTRAFTNEESKVTV